MNSVIARYGGNGSDSEEELDRAIEGLHVAELAIEATDACRQYILKREVAKPKNESFASLQFAVNRAWITPPESENLNVKKYVIYELYVRLNKENDDENPASIQRRYTDFLKLYKELKTKHSQLMQNIAFPKKVLMGNFSQDTIAQRAEAFESLLDHIVRSSILRDSPYFLSFFQDYELVKACRLLDERRNELAVPILENCFTLLNKIFTDRSKAVLLMLCRLVAACTSSPLPHPSADKWAELALRRYEGVSDTDLLALYIPLLHTCSHLWWQLGRDTKLIRERLDEMKKKGINTKVGPSLTQAIHVLDPKAETI